MTALAKTIETLLENKKYSSLRDVLSSMNEADIAAMFSEVSSDSLPLLFRLLPKDLAADTFALMDTDEQELLIRGFSDNEIKEVFDTYNEKVDTVKSLGKKFAQDADSIKTTGDAIESMYVVERVREQFSLTCLIFHYRIDYNYYLYFNHILALF